MAEQALSLRSGARGLRRRWRLVGGLVLGGLACGLLVTLAQPRRYQARADVLLPPSGVDAKGNPLRNMTTELHVVRSTDVLARAGGGLRPPMNPAELRHATEAREVSGDILEVVARAPTARRAATLANAVADEYVATANGTGTGAENASVETLQQQAAALEVKGRELDREITSNMAALAHQDPRSAESVRLAAVVDSLRSQQVEASQALSAVDARLAAEFSVRGTRVLEAAAVPGSPAERRLVHNLSLGAALGLLAAVALVLVLQTGDPRLRGRDDIADAVGCPVLLALTVGRQDARRSWRDLLMQWSPGQVEELAFRRAFGVLEMSKEAIPTQVALVAFQGDGPALRVAVEGAVAAATFGIPTTLLVDLAPGDAPSLRTCINDQRWAAAPARPDLRVVDVTRLPAAEGSDPGLRMWVRTVSRRQPVLSPVSRPVPTVLCVSAGSATAVELASAALASLDAGLALSGVWIADPDPDDRSTSVVGAGLALDARPDLPQARESWAIRGGVEKRVGSGTDGAPGPEDRFDPRIGKDHGGEVDAGIKIIRSLMSMRTGDDPIAPEEASPAGPDASPSQPAPNGAGPDHAVGSAATVAGSDQAWPGSQIPTSSPDQARTAARPSEATSTVPPSHAHEDSTSPRVTSSQPVPPADDSSG